MRKWSRASESDLCVRGLGSIPGGDQLRAVSMRFCGSGIRKRLINVLYLFIYFIYEDKAEDHKLLYLFCFELWS